MRGHPFRVVTLVRLEDAVAACRAVRDELASAPDTGLGPATAKLCEERVEALAKGGE
jgi:hypothetical protein